jgi:hypothetical protein
MSNRRRNACLDRVWDELTESFRAGTQSDDAVGDYIARLGEFGWSRAMMLKVFEEFLEA